jgi:hypothetical protein
MSLEIEQEKMSRINPFMALTADLWTLKLFLGSIDVLWDTADEESSHRPREAAPPIYGSANPLSAGHQGAVYGEGHN